MDKKYGIAIGVGILALACGVIALSNLDDVDKAKRDLNKAVKKVRKKSKNLANLVAEKSENFAEGTVDFIHDFDAEEILDDARTSVSKTMKKAKKKLK